MNLSLEGRTYVVMGVANKRSIAWGIARSLHEAGARLISSYASERFGKAVRELADTLQGENNSLFYECDVTNDEAIIQTFENIQNDVGVIHGLAHCIAFANRDELKDEQSFWNTSRDGFFNRSQHQFLFTYRCGTCRFSRLCQKAEALLPWSVSRRRASRSELQCHGCCESEPGCKHEVFGPMT